MNPFQPEIDRLRRQREPRTLDEWEQFHDLAESFWVELGDLVHRKLANLTDHDLDEALLMRLQEKCSVYGVKR